MSREPLQRVSARLNRISNGMHFLSPSERRCLQYLKDLWIRYGDQPIYPSVAKVAKRIGVSECTARRHMHLLRELGILVEVAPGGGARSTAYQFSESQVLKLASKLSTDPSQTPSRKCQLLRAILNRYPPQTPLANHSQTPSRMPVYERGSVLHSERRISTGHGEDTDLSCQVDEGSWDRASNVIEWPGRKTRGNQ